MSMQIKKRLSFTMRPMNIIGSFLILATLVLQPFGMLQVEAATKTPICASTCTADSIQSAIDAAADGDTVVMPADATLSRQLNIKKSLTFDGNGHTISPLFTKSDNGNNSAIGIIGATDVTIKNLTIAGAGGTTLHGINAYESSVYIDNVFLKDNDRSGLVANSSLVTVNNIRTAGNGWHGINVDQTSDPAILTVNGLSSHSDNVQILVDHPSTASKVIDTNDQYSSQKFGSVIVYTLKPSAPVGLHYSNPDMVCGTATSLYSITAAWTPVSGASAYEYSVTTPGFHNTSNPWSQTVTTNSYSGAFTEGEGVYTFKVRTISNSGSVSNWSSTCSVTYDITAPSAPTITAPVMRQWFRTSPILDTWTAIQNDVSGIANYQIQYVYADGHTFAGDMCDGLAACRSVPGSQTSRNHAVGANEEGQTTVKVRAIDNAGNVGPWSAAVSYYYDHTQPTASFSSPMPGQYISTRSTGWKLDVRGAISDNISSNYAFIQLLNDRHGAVDGKTVYGAFASNSLLHSFDTTNLPDGQYGLSMAAADSAGNVWNTAHQNGYLDFFLDNTKPVIATPVKFSNGVVAENAKIRGSQTFVVSQTETNPQRMYVEYDQLGSDGKWSKKTGQFFYDTNIAEFTVDTSKWPDGKYQIKVSSDDLAKNHSGYAFPLTVDNSAPVISNVTVNGQSKPFIKAVGGTVTIEADITDPNGVNLDSRYTHVRFFHGSVSTAPVQVQSLNAVLKHVDGNRYRAIVDTTSFVPEGYKADYWVYFRLQDSLGNAVGNNDNRGVTVNNSVPSVTATDFGVGSWTLANDGFTAFSAGFTTQDFDALTAASVTVYGADGRELATNTATPAFIGEINTNGWTTLSSPFVTNGSFDDNFCGGGECWDREATQWTAEMKPAKAVVTVTGLNARGESVTETSSIETFSEAVGQFESIVPVIETNVVTPPGLNGQANQPQSRPASRGTFQAARVLARNPSVVTTSSGETNDNSVLGVSTSTEGQETGPEVLSSNVSDTPYENFADAEEAVSQNSTSWLWWLTLPVVLGAGTWIYGASRRNK